MEQGNGRRAHQREAQPPAPQRVTLRGPLGSSHRHNTLLPIRLAIGGGLIL